MRRRVFIIGPRIGAALDIQGQGGWGSYSGLGNGVVDCEDGERDGAGGLGAKIGGETKYRIR